MLARLRKLFRSEPPRTRSFEGAGNGRRWKGFADMPSAQGAALASAAVLARRARGLVANNPLAASAVEAWVSALVGTGIKPQSGIPNLAQEFESWTDWADADLLTDHYGQQAAVVRSLVVNGEAVALILDDGTIRLLDPEQLDRNATREIGNGARVVQGVEFDGRGRRVAYHIRQDQPGAPFATSYDVIRVPAAQVLHIFRPIFPGQVRGLSWFAPVLLRLADHDKSIDAQLQKQLVSALLTGFVISPDGGAAGFMNDDGTASGTVEPSLEPGTMRVLKPGEDVRFSDPGAIGDEAINFLKITAKEISAGLGIPAHVLTGDLTEANYSSLRAGLIEWRRRVEALQHSVVVFQFVRPVWRNFVLRRFLAGANDMPGFERNSDRYFAAKFIVPKFDHVDPLKDAEAETLAIALGLMSRRQAVAARGYDIEALDAEIAADRSREQRLGLNFAAVTLPPRRQELPAT